jgi:maltooligosyltrehalose trehalohydrolase
VTDGRRREFADFGWDADDVPDPQDEATFTRSKLDWAEADVEAHAELLTWHRHLIALRRRHPELADGRLDRVAVVVDEERGRLELHRSGVTVLVNLGTEPWSVGPAGPAAAIPPDGLAILD